MHRVFNYGGTRRPDEFCPRNPSLLASTFTRLSTLHLSRFEWAEIPQHFAAFLLALPAQELQLEWFTFQRSELIMLLKSPLIARTSKNLSFYDLRIRGDDDAITDSSQLPTRTFHFKHCDLHSFECLRWIWKGFFDEANVTFGTFHLRKHNGILYRPDDPSQFTPVLRLIGPSITSLCLSATEEFEHWETALTKGANLLHGCTALTSVHFGPLNIKNPGTTFPRALKNVERLPRNLIEEFGFILATHYNQLRSDPDILFEIPWVNMVETLRNLFPRLKRIKFTITQEEDDSTQLALAIGLEKVKSEILGQLIANLPMQVLFKTYLVEYGMTGCPPLEKQYLSPAPEIDI
ncbi:hypothetical protein H0H93_007064 [Arthromyces matolae]|nr:hypothetical protein H0H93_007064 [Arthromyces matolae]